MTCLPRIRCLLATLLCMAALPAASATSAPPASAAGLAPVAAARLELHGLWEGQRFWARLNAPEARFGKQRLLELLWTPPALGTVHLPDCPLWLLDDRLAVVAFNGRGTLNAVRHDAKAGQYLITREHDLGKDVAPGEDARTIAGPRALDLRLAPLAIALAWRAGSQGDAHVVDLFGPRDREPLSLRWRDAELVLAGTTYRIAADDAGRLRSMTRHDAAGPATAPLLSVTAWLMPGSATGALP